MKKLTSVIWICALGACSSPAPSESDAGDTSALASPRRPNLVLVYVDDWGWRDAAFQGSTFYETPRMDAFAAEGMVFTEAYSAGPNCAPSRASLMTGRYTPRHGILTVGSSKRGKANNRKLVPIENETVLTEAEITLAEILRDAGYRTAQIGKWHLGDDSRTQGFDTNVGGFKAGHPKSYFAPYKNPALEDGPEGEYLTDRLTDEALSFLRANAAEPFFLYLSHYAVHTPIQARLDDTAPFLDKPPDGGQQNAKYAGMVASVDRSLGRVLDTLDELDLADDTLVILTSDNGGHGVVTSNAPLRGAKGMLFEGGVRVPFVVRWPGHIAPGSRSAEPIHGIDVLPTMVELAGAELPAGVPIDGVSLAAAFAGEDLQRDALFWHFPVYLEGNQTTAGPWRTTPAGTVRAGRWKLIEWFETGKLELYDLRADPGETRDIALEKTDVAIALAKRLESWRDVVGAQVPTELEPLYVGN